MKEKCTAIVKTLLLSLLVRNMYAVTLTREILERLWIEVF